MKGELMSGLTTEDIVEIVKQEKVRFIQFTFMDIRGIPKNVTKPADKLEPALTEGVIFDGSSVAGYAEIHESDMRLHPDLNTFCILPANSQDGDKYKTATIICDVFDSMGKPFEGDPRFILKSLINKVIKKGYNYYTGPEFEFFLFRLENDEPSLNVSDYGGYFDLMPVDRCETVRKDIVNYLYDFKGYSKAKNGKLQQIPYFDIEAVHHEVAPGQQEIDFRYTDALNSADRVFLLKFAIKTVAQRNGYWATFMPKPLAEVNGSGMHVHQSLIAADKKQMRNVFYDERNKYGLSKEALYFMAGLLENARANCAILASWVNSYKRLIPGYEAPTYISWANKNRSALIRIPSGRGMSTRLEVRNPDPAGNPYLQYAAMLGAGMNGIEKKIKPPEPVEKDIYKLDKKATREMNIAELPGDLGEALHLLEESKLMRATLGKHIINNFLFVKGMEWDEYRAQVTEWEIEKFLPIL
jgi:glutamine synthetase